MFFLCLHRDVFFSREKKHTKQLEVDLDENLKWFCGSSAGVHWSTGLLNLEAFR